MDAPSWTVAELAGVAGGTVSGDDAVRLCGMQSLDDATTDELSFITSAKYRDAALSSNAGALVIPNDLDLNDDRPCIRVANVDQSVLRILEHIDPAPSPQPGIHPRAVVADDADIDPSASIGPGCHIGAGVRIGAGSVLHANVVIEPGCTLGERVVLHPGVVIGSAGFGFRPMPPDDDHPALHLRRMPHLGTVEIGDDVELGANTCVDRGKFGATVIGSGTKVDNLVQIAHNCRIGANCVIAASVAIGGSTVFGDWVQVGGGTSFADHVNVGDRAKIGGHSGVIADVPADSFALGLPADNGRDTLKQWAAVRRLPSVIAQMSGRRSDAPRKSDQGSDPST